MKHAKRSGWRPFWAALCAALLVLLPLVGGTVLLSRAQLRSSLRQAAKSQSGVPIRLPKATDRCTVLLCVADETPGFAGLPERRAELHLSAGGARRAGSALWGQKCPPCGLLRRRRPRPLPGGAGRGVRPAGGYRLSCHRPGGADKACGAVRRSAGGFYRGAHTGAAGAVRQRHRGAGHFCRRCPQLFSGAGCRHFSFAPAQRRRPGGGVGCVFPAGAGAAAHHPAAGSAGGEQQPADQPDRRRPCYTGTHAGIFSHQRRAGGYHR